MNKIYINSIKQISAQSPLTEDWFEHPIFYSGPSVRAIEPDYKQFFTPNESRRLKKILKRALLVSRQTMAESKIVMPDAIITATGLGCIENTEFFLDAMVREGEKLLNPTPFMQSTHNTIGSVIGMDLKCHGYNTHYSQKYVSFECGLQDALMQLQNENIHNVLLNAHDEHSPIFDSILKHLNCWHFSDGGFKGEVAVSMMLTNQQSSKNLCCVKAMLMCYKPSISHLQVKLQELLKHNKLDINEIDAVFVGVNGNENNDSVYLTHAETLFPDLPLLRYKHLFGEHFTVSGLGFYVAATCLQQERVPKHLLLEKDKPVKQVKHLLLYNHSENKEHTIILLTNEMKNNK